MAKSKYQAQNRIEGLTKSPLELDETVDLEDEVAAPFVAGGSLKPVSKPAKADKGDGDKKGD